MCNKFDFTVAMQCQGDQHKTVPVSWVTTMCNCDSGGRWLSIASAGKELTHTVPALDA